MTKYLLGIDAGHTVTKAVLFNELGEQIQVGRGSNEQLSPHPAWQERSMEEALRAATEAVRSATQGIDPEKIVGIGVCGHSDGLYILDKNQKPFRNAILATDNRADQISTELAESIGARLLELIGQHLFPASPAALLLWLRKNEPEVFQQIGAVMHCKDWIRFGLTGVLGTDVSDASGSFADLNSHMWSDETLEITGLTELKDALPPLHFSDEIVGYLTEESAKACGLKVGIPVIAGAHDVHAAAVGVGAYGFGEASLIFGTWSINQVFASKPEPDLRWHTRASIAPNRWLHMSTSPTSASNANWFWDLIGVKDLSELTTLLDSLESVILQEDRPLYFPYLFGGPAGSNTGAQFIDLRGWHSAEHLAASVIEGVIFNHKHHLDMLATKLDMNDRLIATGGSIQSPVWAQLIADIFQREIGISDTEESGARGMAILSGVAVGIFESLDQAIKSTTRISRVVNPNVDRKDYFNQRYEKYRLHALELLGI